MNNADPGPQKTTDAGAGAIPAQRGTTPASGPPGRNTALPQDQLPGLRAEFPCFRIWREYTCDRVRYIARSLHLKLNPHTVVTDDIRELRGALEPARYAACPGPHAAACT